MSRVIEGSILIFTLFSNAVFAQTGKNDFQYISINEGLSNAYVHAITQDEKGYIWIGTDDGLNKYNGYEIEVYRNEPDNASSLTNNSVDALLNDSRGRLWVGTEEGLELYNPDMDQFIHVRNSGNFSISALFESKDSTIWIGTDKGIAQYSEDSRALEKKYFFDKASSGEVFNDDGFSINVFREYNDRYLIVGTWDGLFVVDRRQNSLKWITKSDNLDTEVDHINSIEIDGNKNIWIGVYGGGLYQFDKARNSFRKISIAKNCNIDDRIMYIFDDNAGNIWIGTEQSGLYKLYINSYGSDGYEYEHFIDNDWPGSLSYRSVTCLFKDSESGLWIGTHNGGVNYLGSDKKYFKSVQRNPFIENTISHEKVWGLCEDDNNNIWIGTDGGGLDVYNKETKEIRSFSADGKNGSISDNAILCAYKDSENDLWFGTYSGGLNLYLPDQQIFKTFKHKSEDSTSIGKNDVRTILEGKQGKIWVGTNQGGLNLLDKETGKFKRYNTENSNLGSNDIRSLHLDEEQRLWIGSYGQGLFLFEGGKFKNFKIGDGNSSDNIIFSIEEDSSGILWLGTYGTGLVSFNPTTENFEIFDEKKGLSNNIVHAVALDRNNNIWLSSNKGISKFNIIDHTFRNFSTSDGLPTLAFNDGAVLKSDDGKFYFGSLDGLVFFNPNEAFQQLNIPDVIIEELKLFNKKIRPDTTRKNSLLSKGISNSDHITFKSNQSVFSLQYVAIHYPNPHRIHYSYMLEGVDKQWNYVGDLRNATYTTLPSGDYTFKVRASLDNKNWSEETSMKVTILPPFWSTWWAYLIYILLAVAVFYATVWYRTNKANMKRMIEIEQLEKQKLSEIYNVKMNFFTNISHEFRTPLTLIISPLEQIIRDQNVSLFIKNKLLSIFNHAHRLQHLINQLMEFRKVETGNMELKVTENDLVKFTYEVYFAFMELSRANNIKYEFSSAVDNLKLWFNQKHFETILYNLISNAFKYTPAQGKISVEIKAPEDDQKYCEVHIKDNGKGISPEYVDQIFNRYFQVVEAETINIMGTGIGLALVKDLVEVHKGEIAVKSGKDLGTEIILKFKIGKDHFSKDQIIEEHLDSEHPHNYEVTSEWLNEAAIDLNEKSSHKGHKHALLIIEDNQDIRNYIKSLFISSYKVIEAGDGEEGLSLAKSKSPSVIISDIMMPGIDGIELCRTLKNDHNTSHIPVVLLTARADNLHKLEGISIGADDYITKPFNADILKAKINTLISNQARLHEYYTSRILLQPIADDVEASDKAFLDKAIELVEKNLLTPEFGIKDLMDELCVSQPTLYRRIKQLTGESTSEFIRSVRIKRAAELIRQNNSPITQIAYDVGFSSARYFRDSFFKIYKKTPSEYAKECRSGVKSVKN